MRLETEVGAIECTNRIVLVPSVFSTRASKHQSLGRVGVDDVLMTEGDSST